MIQWLSNLIGAVAALALISAALVYMVSPKRGRELLRRFAIFIAGAFAGICLLHDFAVRIAPLALALLGTAVILAAYFVREARQGRPLRQPNRRGAERMPMLPQHDEEDQ